MADADCPLSQVCVNGLCQCNDANDPGCAGDGVCDPDLMGDPDCGDGVCDPMNPADPDCGDGVCDPMNPADPDC